MKGYFWAASGHILITSYSRKWTKHIYASQVTMNVLWQRVIKNCATKYKTSYRLHMVGPKLPLHCYVWHYLLYLRYLWVILVMFVVWDMRVCDSDVECMYHISARWSFSFKFGAYTCEVILLCVWGAEIRLLHTGSLWTRTCGAKPRHASLNWNV